MKKLITLCFILSYCGLHSQTCIPNTNSLNFNGTTDYVDFSTVTNLDPTTAVSVEAWIYAAAWSANRYENSIFCHHSGFGPNGLSGFALRAGANGTLSFVIGGDSAGVTDWHEAYSNSGVLPLNQWTHVAATFDGSIIKLYKNGVFVTDLPFAGTIKVSTMLPKIGRYSDTLHTSGGQRLWNGKLDEIRVWNRALTQAEIADSMSIQITPSAQTGLIGYWKFNEGSGQTLNDSSVNVNSGTIYGATWSTSVPFNNSPPVPNVIFTGTQLYVTNACPNYQWYLDGNIIPGANGQFYNPSVNGTYTVVDTNAYCSNTSAPFVLTTLSVNENDINNLISLSPNPVTDLLHINIRNTSFHSIDIFGIDGRKVFHRSEIKSELTIPVNDFAKGIYIAKFQGNDGVISKKFVVE